MTTLTTSRMPAATAATAAGLPQTVAASAIVRISDATYQNGITRPSTRPPSARAASDAPDGSRRKMGLTKTATANSTPTMSPQTVAATTASVWTTTAPLMV